MSLITIPHTDTVKKDTAIAQHVFQALLAAITDSSVFEYDATSLAHHLECSEAGYHQGYQVPEEPD